MDMVPLAFLGNIGPWQWLIILFIALLIFGRRLPEMMRGMGQGVREFRKGLDSDAEADAKTDAEEPRRVGRVEDSPQSPPEGQSRPEPAEPSASPADAAAQQDPPKE